MTSYASIPLLGASLDIVLYDIEEVVKQTVMPPIISEAKRLEKIFNIFDPESELSRLNTQRVLRVSPEMLEVVSTALQLCKQTKYSILERSQKRSTLLSWKIAQWQLQEIIVNSQQRMSRIISLVRAIYAQSPFLDLHL